MTSTSWDKRLLKNSGIILIWLVIWQVVTMLINNTILLAGPIDTIKALCILATTSKFWLSLLSSFLRIIGGFLIGVTLASLLSALSYKCQLIKDFLNPLVLVIKSIPVASFVIIVLIWVGAPNLSLIISSLVVFPIVYLSLLEGLTSIDIKLIEMASVFRIKPLTTFKNIYLRSLKPFLLSSLGLASGMCFKSGIAAEVIGRPKFSIGNNIYSSKAYLNTADIFAWTIVAILLAFVFEKFIKFILRRVLSK